MKAPRPDEDIEMEASHGNKQESREKRLDTVSIPDLNEMAVDDEDVIDNHLAIMPYEGLILDSQGQWEMVAGPK